MQNNAEDEQFPTEIVPSIPDSTLWIVFFGQSTSRKEQTQKMSERYQLPILILDQVLKVRSKFF